MVNILTDPMWSERASPVQFAGPRRWSGRGSRSKTCHRSTPPAIAQPLNDHLDARQFGAWHGRIQKRPGRAAGLAAFVANAASRQSGARSWIGGRSTHRIARIRQPGDAFSSRASATGGHALVRFALSSEGANGRRVYFAGDTGYHPEFGAIGERYGPFECRPDADRRVRAALVMRYVP